MALLYWCESNVLKNLKDFHGCDRLQKDMRLIGFSILFALILGPHAHAQDSAAQQIEDHFRLFIINESRQNPGDRTVVKKTRQGLVAVFYYWRNLDNRNPADVICDGYEWLLLGRTRYGKGAKSAFQKFNRVEAFELHFFDLEFGIKRGRQKGAFVSTSKPKEYFRIRVTKDDLKKGNFNETWIRKQLDENRCQNLKSLFSNVWFDKEYMRENS